MARDRAGTALLHLAGLEDWANTEAGGKVVGEVEEVEEEEEGVRCEVWDRL